MLTTEDAADKARKVAEASQALATEATGGTANRRAGCKALVTLFFSGGDEPKKNRQTTKGTANVESNFCLGVSSCNFG